jgi:hypothetical protein
MHRKVIGVIFAVALSAPTLANAQVVTLDFQGTPMTGTYSAGIGSTPVTISGDVLSAVITTDVDPNSRYYDAVITAQALLNGFPLDVGPKPLDATSINFIFSDGEITGANVNYSSSSCGGSICNYEALTIGSNGGSSYTFEDSGGNTGTMPQVCIPYCGIIESSAGGAWTVTQAPEIDPASAASGLTLLLGGLAVLRGRRMRPGPGDTN